MESDASTKDIKKAYRRLSKIYHPDKHIGATPEELAIVEERFREITEAYEILIMKEMD